MPRPTKAHSGNGATSGEKLAPKLASTADAPGSQREAIARATALSSLAIVGGLISQVILDISQEGSRLHGELSERLSALSKAAVESESDPEHVLKTVPPEIESMLEQVCGKQLALWSEISQRMARITVLLKMIEPKSSNQTLQPFNASTN